MRALHRKVWLALLLFAIVAAVLGRDILFDWDHLQIEAERSRRHAQAALGVPLAGTPDLAALDKRLAAAGLSLGAPVFMRVFKREFELELWMKRDDTFQRGIDPKRSRSLQRVGETAGDPCANRKPAHERGQHGARRTSRVSHRHRQEPQPRDLVQQGRGAGQNVQSDEQTSAHGQHAMVWRYEESYRRARLWFRPRNCGSRVVARGGDAVMGVRIRRSAACRFRLFEEVHGAAPC